jgi:RNA polymerase sigma-70 factor, ECF subfamily
LEHELEHLKYMSSIDKDSFRELMHTYGQEVWNYAYFMTKRSHMADDVTQEVFLSVYKNIGSFRGQSSLKTWLFSITRNTAVNYMRSAFFRKVTLTGFLPGGKSVPSAEKEALVQEELHDIWRVVMKLPIKLREVLILDAKYEMTAKEIAELLGISQGTVKSRLSRARERINAMWKEEMVYERV